MLQDQTAVITGGAKGLGLAIAETFLANGARVVLADIDGDLVGESAEKLRAGAIGVACDVTDPGSVQRAADTAVGEFGSLDVFVNNAGITRDATMRRMTLEDFEAVLDIHLKGTWLGTRAAAAVMREQGSGAIVNLSSISGKVGMAGQTNYSAAKAGVVGMTKAAAKELAHRGVRVNAIQPGLIRTDMTAALRQDIFDAKVAEIPLQRVGDPSEIASVALFLAGRMSSYMTGCVLEVAGGRHI
ncbi:3-oxoacyl-[acyl-carrier protein] reductase [Pseudonocardia sp. Ae168_Ps1]|uniref:3-oxoacyl-ACP reductase FabG n=1 Tax=unclassified Pseudonocardia TaxID=2619320 RepID=UPI00094B61D6|nr:MULTISPECIES: 3-oxoacyl-ACP reductase FabG [unclassified Pseudonocardia]OLL76834.1 3-oxoacyl-[acyl-carrier protein] reductase [Pseudonocardia sp. Ae150A_Ps1]OLL82848.1 3-oxoacyl-[acyl-carrier protein] reductase [Pseudonocardia sp. Ae168_Ps1]OLL83040.1 3-oxoacyl-[acyl-carrier protein] reductase [Pseudonocardia sp. Ae263_Ps1]OLL90921.1 3-oxoacyl-[acyl-carrier protein] reductase [Pseudonocardia sp. Ae356_Ps1]